MKKIQITNSAKTMGSYPIAELLEKKAEMRRKELPVYDFGAGDDPFPIDEGILSYVKDHLPATSAYPLVRGTVELQDTIASYLNRRFAVEVQREGILPVTGSKEGIYHLASLVIDHKSKRRNILGPALAYPVYGKGALAVHAQYVPLKGDREENYLLELHEVSPKILNETAIAYLNYPHNPTGAGCTLEYFTRQVETAAQYGIILVSDECYADIYFGATPPPSILQVTQEGVLAFHSLSKRSGMTGFRSGFVAGDPYYIDGYARIRNSIGTAMPEPIMLASIAAWGDDSHVEKRRAMFKPIRERFIRFFDELGLEYLKTDATFYLWAKAPKGHTGKSYADALRKKEIFVAPADYFGSGSPEWFRVSLIHPVDFCEKTFALWREICPA